MWYTQENAQIVEAKSASASFMQMNQMNQSMGEVMRTWDTLPLVALKTELTNYSPEEKREASERITPLDQACN